MNRIATLAGLGLLLSASLAQAAGPLLMQETDPPRPFAWDMTQGPVPVYTDGGGAFTYAIDGVTPFITIARANEITQFAFSQWSNVPTSSVQGRHRRHDRKPDRHCGYHGRECGGAV